jgi:hypothetical protein
MLQIKLAPPTTYSGILPVADMKAYVTNGYHTPAVTGISKHGTSYGKFLTILYSCCWSLCKMALCQWSWTVPGSRTGKTAVGVPKTATISISQWTLQIICRIWSSHNGGFLLDLLFDPEDWGNMFLRNFQHTTWRYNPKDRALQSK